MTNNVKYYINGALYSVILAFTSGGIIQTFFSHIGFSPAQISTYATVLSVVQILVMVLNIFISDGIKNVKKVMSLLILSHVILCVGMLPFCILEEFDVKIVYAIVIILCCIVNLFVGFYNVLCYRLPYMIIDIGEYANIENVKGMISGIVSIATSALITYFSTLFSFEYVMGAGFIISSIFCVASSIAIVTMKVKPNMQENKKKQKFALSKLKQREFLYFYTPNFLRGCSMGIMNIIAVICMKDISQNSTVISALVTILSVSSIIGCFIYRNLEKKVKTVNLYMICSIQMFLCLPFMMLGKNELVFCLFYFFTGVGFNIINIAGAVFATEIIDYTDIGTYTSIRLITMTAGQAISAFLVSLLIDYIPCVIILIACGTFQLVSGIMYHAYKNKSVYSYQNLKNL